MPDHTTALATRAPGAVSIAPFPAGRQLTTKPGRLRRALAAALAVLTVAGAAAAGAQPAGATTLSATQASIARAVLARLNAERAIYRLPALRMNVHLVSSAHSHNLAMAAYNTMSHQLPHEAYFTTRISRAGYRWSWAGENVAWNSVQNQAGALALEVMMFNERAPYDSHRLNILSRRFTDIGIDIYIDARTHKLWMTEDFGRPG